ncbi:hypothetical protein BDQ12DRAFT_674550 [Crucibulum laeve]|uniref:Uncharacterized protein n=1 Tax=Crucibulum laeve TaxID=68775 RepID=A0A5C3MGY2_9AGAR|nr:hypothetical protein BDQ12DRAFT_674550 [Crucibulum laeve]
MENAFKGKSKDPFDEGDELSELEELSELDEPSVPQIAHIPGFSISNVYPPHPCERCVRTNKTCKGIAGARCEYCKRLKQKCTNSTGPGRGRRTASAKLAVQTPNSNIAETSTSHLRGKRKANSMQAGTSQGFFDSEEDVDDGHHPPAKMNKKSRSSKPTLAPAHGSGRRAQLLQIVDELQSAHLRLQSTVTKELKKMQETISLLSSEIQELDGDQ